MGQYFLLSEGSVACYEKEKEQNEMKESIKSQDLPIYWPPKKAAMYLVYLQTLIASPLNSTMLLMKQHRAVKGQTVEKTLT